MKKGQLLIESGVAISILVIGLLGIFGLLSRSLSLNNVVASRYIASNLAAEGIEVVKNLIDGNIVQFNPWNEGINTGSYEVAFDGLVLNPDQNRFLLLDPASNTYNYQTGQPTLFKRTIQITNIGSDEIKVNSIVNWQIRGGSYSVNLEDHFFNWRGASASVAPAPEEDVDLVQLPDTNHSYVGGSGPFSIDGDWNTSQTLSSSGDYDSSAETDSQHNFAAAHTIHLIKFRTSASAHVYGDSEQTADIHWYVQYYNGSWATVSGSQYDNSCDGNCSINNDSGTVTLTVNLANITAIKAYAYGHTHSNGDSRTNESSASIYEIQAWGPK